MTLPFRVDEPPPGFDHGNLTRSPYIHLPALRHLDEDVNDVCERIYQVSDVREYYIVCRDRLNSVVHKACSLGSELHAAYKEMSSSIDWNGSTVPFSWDESLLSASQDEMWPAQRDGKELTCPDIPLMSSSNPEIRPLTSDDVVEQVALSDLPLRESCAEASSDERFAHFPAKVLFPNERRVERQKSTRLVHWSAYSSLPDVATERDNGDYQFQEEPSREIRPSKEEEKTEAVSNTAALRDIIGDANKDSSQAIRKKLQSLVDYYHFSLNRGFGLIRVTNSFTIPDMNKSKDFCPKLHLSNESVLIEVYFPRNERFALFQAVDVLTETGIPLATAVDKLVIMEMDGGIDAAYLRSITPLPLVPYFPEIPFMPVRRLANHIDKAKLRSKDVDEREALRLCNRLLADKYRHLNMNIKWVEFQVDRKKLLIFAEFREYVTFSNYVKEVCFLVKNYLKKRHNTRYPLRIYIQRKLVQPEDIDFKAFNASIVPPCKPNQRRISRINKSTVAVAVSS